MELTSQHIDLLLVVEELEEPKKHPSTADVGRRLLEVWKERGGPYFWNSSPPWHGTSPFADELRAEGLLEVHVGMAQFRRWDQPAGTPDRYWLSLTDAGRAILRDRGLL